MSSNSEEKLENKNNVKTSLPEVNESHESMSRREVLKRAGKLAYVAPTLNVLSLAAPVHALSGPPPPPDESPNDHYDRPPRG